MKKINIFLIIILFCVPAISNSQTYLRKSNQSAQDFAKEFLPKKSAFCHQVIEYNFGKTTYGKNIIVFYKDITKKDVDVLGFTLFRTDKLDHYQKVMIGDTIEPSMDNSSRIVSIAFANADSDIEKEIIVLIEQDIRLVDETGTGDSGIGDFGYIVVYDSEPKKQKT